MPKSMTLEELDTLRGTLLVGAVAVDATVALQLEWIAIIEETIERIERTRALIPHLEKLLRPPRDEAGPGTNRGGYNLLEIRQFNANASISLARHVASAFFLRTGTSHRVAEARHAIATSKTLIATIDAFIGAADVFWAGLDERKTSCQVMESKPLIS